MTPNPPAVPPAASPISPDMSGPRAQPELSATPARRPAVAASPVSSANHAVPTLNTAPETTP